MKRTYMSCLSMKKDFGSFLKKDLNRISGRIARSLALNSPWIDVIKSKNMKKYKTTLKLKNYSVENLSTVIFERKLKVGTQVIRVSDLLKDSCEGTYNITIKFTPRGERRIRK